jgi:hypothetical protein
MENVTSVFNVEGIIAVAGKSELLKMVAKSRTGLIAAGLTTGKKVPISAQQGVSALAEIAIYALDREVPLKEVLAAMYAKFEGATTEHPKKMDNAALKADFETILPDFDQERVYVSDIKKVYTWYNQLINAGFGLVEVTEETPEAEATTDA